jgi:VIT1/CCC1 family predicted Fe2+/Mn2+ transporter
VKISIRKGLGFGLTSGIITTLGLIIGLNSGTHSKAVVIGGIFVIAIADAFSDALGIHISEEAGSKTTTTKQVWESTISTFIFKFIFALLFVVPIIFLELTTAVITSIILGTFLLAIFSYYIAKEKGINPKKAVAEHLLIMAIVIVATHFVGNAVAYLTRQ